MGLLDLFHNNKKRDNLRDTLQGQLHRNESASQIEPGSSSSSPSSSSSGGQQQQQQQPQKQSKRKSLAMFLKKRHTINWRVSRESSELCRQDGVMEEIRRKLAEHDAHVDSDSMRNSSVMTSSEAQSSSTSSPQQQQQQQSQLQQQSQQQQQQQNPVYPPNENSPSKDISTPSKSTPIPTGRLSNSLPLGSNHLLPNVIGSLGAELDEDDANEKSYSAPTTPRSGSTPSTSPTFPPNPFPTFNIENSDPSVSTSSTPNNADLSRKKVTQKRASIDFPALLKGPSVASSSKDTEPTASSSSGTEAPLPIIALSSPSQRVTKSAIPLENDASSSYSIHVESNTNSTTATLDGKPVVETRIPEQSKQTQTSNQVPGTDAAPVSSTPPQVPPSPSQSQSSQNKANSRISLSATHSMGFRYNNVVSSGSRMHLQYFVKPSISSGTLGTSQSPRTPNSTTSRESRRFSGGVPLPSGDLMDDDDDNIMLNTDDPKVKILIACATGDLEMAKELLEVDPSLVSSLDPVDRSSPLHKAAGRNDTAMAVLLLDKGANVNSTDLLDACPIHWAAASQSADVIAVLISRGSKVNIRDKYGYAPLHLTFRMRNEFANNLKDRAAGLPLSAEEISAESERKQKRFRVVEELLFFGADINFKKEDGTTALHMCCERNDTDAVEFLVKHKAILNVRDRWGETPLISAASNNAVKVVAALLRGLDSTPDLMKAVIQARDDNGYSVLHRCAQTGNNDLLKLIVVKMTPELSSKIVNNPDVRTQSTPLHIAVAKHYSKVVRSLLFIGADVNAQDIDGDTPLHVACRNKNEELIRMLLLATAPNNPEKRLCRLDIRNKRKETAKQVAKRQEINLKQLIMSGDSVSLV